MNGGFHIITAEVSETKFPVRLADCYSLLWFECAKTLAWGLNGFGDGTGPLMGITRPDGRTEHPLKMRASGVRAGTVIETRTGGGGGNRNPKARAFEDMRRDVVGDWSAARSPERCTASSSPTHSTWMKPRPPRAPDTAKTLHLQRAVSACW